MTNKKFQSIITHTTFLLLPNIVMATTPTINNVSGVVVSGQSLTITGTAMVDEDRANWHDLFSSGNLYGFEGTYEEQVSDPGWDLDDRYNHAPDADPGETTYDTVTKIMGNNSYKGRIIGAHPSNASAGLVIDSGVARGDLYVRFYSRWHSAGEISKWPTSHIKMVDIQGNTGGPNQLYFQPAANDGTVLPSQLNMAYNSSSHLYDANNFLEDNRWYCMEARFKNTLVEPNFTTWMDNVEIDSISSDLGDLTSMEWILFGMINMAGTGADFDLTNWIDNFTVSTSRIYPSSIIEVSGDGITWKYQEPLFLSDTSSQIKLDLSGLTGTNYQLRVTNNRQETSAIYSLLGGGDMTAPNAPSGLSVL